MIKTFTSYHHRNDQHYKELFVEWAQSIGAIEDMSVGLGDIDDRLSTQAIRRRIRDEYLMDTQVTVLLAGAETRFRKHVDWELKSSMIDGQKNRKSGILIVNLPTSGSTNFRKSYDGEAELIYPEYNGKWISISEKAEYLNRYPNMPRRIIDNFARTGVKISVVPWDKIYGYADRLDFLLRNSAEAGTTNDYDLQLKMRMRDHNPNSGNVDHRTLRPWEVA